MMNHFTIVKLYDEQLLLSGIKCTFLRFLLLSETQRYVPQGSKKSLNRILNPFRGLNVIEPFTGTG